jgi:hypothetical protein
MSKVLMGCRSGRMPNLRQMNPSKLMTWSTTPYSLFPIPYLFLKTIIAIVHKYQTNIVLTSEILG